MLCPSACDPTPFVEGSSAMSTPRYRVLTPVLFLLLAFGLRLHDLTGREYSLDESWSYVHAYFIAYPGGISPLQVLAPEPNNALHLVLTSAHPSPLSAHSGFFGSKPFSKANNFLTANGRGAIEW